MECFSLLDHNVVRLPHLNSLASVRVLTLCFSLVAALLPQGSAESRVIGSGSDRVLWRRLPLESAPVHRLLLVPSPLSSQHFSSATGTPGVNLRYWPSGGPISAYNLFLMCEPIIILPHHCHPSHQRRSHEPHPPRVTTLKVAEVVRHRLTHCHPATKVSKIPVAVLPEVLWILGEMRWETHSAVHGHLDELGVASQRRERRGIGEAQRGDRGDRSCQP